MQNEELKDLRRRSNDETTYPNLNTILNYTPKKDNNKKSHFNTIDNNEHTNPVSVIIQDERKNEKVDKNVQFQHMKSDKHMENSKIKSNSNFFTSNKIINTEALNLSKKFGKSPELNENINSTIYKRQNDKELISRSKNLLFDSKIYVNFNLTKVYLYLIIEILRTNKQLQKILLRLNF